MTPTLIPGDIIIVDTWAYQDTTAAIGDIVIFTKPYMPRTFLIKRIKQVSTDKMAIQPSYFIVGDNKKYSSDSRHFGWVVHTSIRGKAVNILLSRHKQGFNFIRTNQSLAFH